MKTLLLSLILFACTIINATPPTIGGYNVYYGHLHNHTNYSDGAGTPKSAYNYAKNTAKLDFFGLSDHDTDIDSLEWADTKAQADAFNQDGIFTTFCGFEWSYYRNYGHVTVVGTPDYTTVIATNTFEKLKTWLSTREGIAFFNHPGREDANGKEFDHFTGKPSDKFVGIELWNKNEGFSAFYYNDGYTPNDNSKGFYEEALGLGWKIGASGSADNHLATWGTSEDYRMAILSNNLTRNDLWQAMQARRFYSTMDKNLALSFKINNQEMGSTQVPGTYTTQIQASDGDGELFTSIKLYDKTHNVIQEWTPNSAIVNVSTNLTTAHGDFYYVKVTEADGGEAISSPIWIVAADTQAPTAFTVTKGAVTSSSVELLLNATDNSGAISYTVSYGNGLTMTTTGASATQKSCIITGLTPSTNYTFSVTVKDAANNVAANNPVSVDAKTTSTVQYIVSSSPGVPTPYSLAYLTDGNTTTNWKVQSAHASYITFEYASAKTFNKVVLTSTIDDAPSRDPKNWTIKASNDTLAGWTVLDAQTNQTFATRGLSKTYSFTNNTAYKFYRLHITESYYSTSSTMLAEIAFLGDTIVPTDTIAPTAFTASKGAVTSNSVELLLNATDNSGSINYTISFGTVPTVVTVSGVSATQKSYIVTGLTPATAYTFSVTAKDAANNVAANNPQVVAASTSAVADTIAPTAFTATKGVVTSSSVELLLNATDNSGAINYTISYGTVPTIVTVVGVSATQKSYIVTGLTPATAYTFSVTAKDAANNIAVNNPIVVTASTSSVADTIAPTAFTATKGVVTSSSIELLLNATDNSGSINYTISYGTVPTIVTVVGVSATQKSYIVSGLTPATAYTFSVTAKDAANNIAVNNPIVVSASTSAVVDTIAPTAFAAIKGVVTTNSVELLLNATDNSGSINYTISYGTIPIIVTITGVSATQKSYIISGLTPATVYYFSVTAKDAANNAAVNNPIVVAASTSALSGPALIVTSSPSVPAPYSVAYLTDGNTATNWKVLSAHASYITFEYASAKIFNKVVLTSTIDDAPSRDPKNWTIKASNDTLAGWTVLDTQTNQTFATRGLSKPYSFVNNTAYKFYRLYITESYYSTSSTMLAEIAFSGDTIVPTDTQAPTAFTASKGAITSSSVELLLNATDNSGAINYTISYGTVPTVITITGVSATQKSYIITGLMPATAYTFSVTVKDAANNIAVNNPIVFAASTSAVTDTIAPTAFTATKGVVTSSSVELLLNATDNSGAINYTISYGTTPTIVTITGVSATQKLHIITGLTPATVYTFSVTAKDEANNIAVNNPIVVAASTSEVADTIAPTAFTATKGVVTSSSVELLLNATDNSGSINYTISYGTIPIIVTITGVSATQKSYIITGLIPATAYNFSVTVKDAANNIAVNNPIVFAASTSAVADTIAPTAFTASKGAITSSSVELLLNATDNSGAINYTISYGTTPTIVTITGVSATQKSYIITGLTPATAYTFSVTAKDAANNIAVNNPIVIAASTSAVADTIAPTAFTATKGVVTSSSVELLLNATDNSGSINYTISYGTVPTIITVAGVSATQKSYIISGLTPATAYIFSVTAKDAANNIAVNNPIVVAASTSALSGPALIVTSSPSVPAPYSLAYLTDGNTATNWKVLSAHASYITFEYASAKTFNKVALTSTIDDAPSRDPKNWTIKASNDTLAGWTVLDTRTNQTFATRGLSKPYSFVNNTAYKFYRLHITESYYSTTSTMLAEIAFSGDTITAPANAKQVTVNDTASMIVESEIVSTLINKQIIIYSSNRTLFIKNTSDSNGDLYLFDIYGRFILKHPFNGNNTTSISLNLPSGIYVAIGTTLTQKAIKNLILP